MEGQITTAQLALMLTLVGIFVSVLSTLGMFLLQRLFGSGDKAGAEITTLRDRLHAVELGMVAQYATRSEMEMFRNEVRTQFEALRKDVNKILSHFSPNAAFPE